MPSSSWGYWVQDLAPDKSQLIQGVSLANSWVRAPVPEKLLDTSQESRQNPSPRVWQAKAGDERRGIDNGSWLVLFATRALQLLANARCHMLVGTSLDWHIYLERWSLNMGGPEACKGLIPLTRWHQDWRAGDIGKWRKNQCQSCGPNKNVLMCLGKLFARPK